jgi:hypothetical protein
MKRIFLFLMVTAFIFSANAQKIKLVEGDVGFLKGQDKLKVEFTYDNMKIGKTQEKDYTAKKVKEKNKDEAGSGDAWLEKWENDKQEAYPRFFTRMFNVMLSKRDVSIDKNADDAEYIMIVNTSFIEPGYNVGISSKRASANMDVSLVSKDDPGKVLAKFSITKSPGNSMFGSNYSTVDRVGGCYENAAAALASYFIKKKSF